MNRTSYRTGRERDAICGHALPGSWIPSPRTYRRRPTGRQR